MTELIIVRHGETCENKLGICQGQTEGTLSEDGKKQNKLLARDLRNFKIDRIYSSPLARAVETGNEIWKYHKDIELQTDIRLIERNMGVLQGEMFPDNFDITKPVNGMESIEFARIRMKSFLDDILPLHTNQTVLIISHGLAIKVLTAILMNMSDDNIIDMKLMKNSCYSIYYSDNNQGFKIK
ncbi:MAG: histidine phosphatase family protein [Bacteroidales bacterium]|nr:histidine phosphatase family protein [Bacteroidales bacterium]